MIELPEAITITNDLNRTILNKKIKKVITHPESHKFAFFEADASNYDKLLQNKEVTNIRHYGFYVSIEIEEMDLLFRDGINLRYHDTVITVPQKYQMLVEFSDHTFLTASVSMYGCLFCVNREEFNENEYLNIAKRGVIPTTEKFNYQYFNDLWNNCKDTISAKAFLGTEQRIIGIGNGVLQDILFYANIHPKKKLKDITEEQKKELFQSIKNTLNEMINKGGRDTEKNIFGEFGEYKTALSKNSIKEGCINCGNSITKENFLGGTIYFCSNCQKI